MLSGKGDDVYSDDGQLSRTSSFQETSKEYSLKFKVFSEQSAGISRPGSGKSPIAARCVSATMSAASRSSVSSTPPTSHLAKTKSGDMLSHTIKSKQRNGPRVRLVCGTCGLALWALIIVLWICQAMPEAADTDPVKLSALSPGIKMIIKNDRSGRAKPYFVVLLIGAMIGTIFISAYSLTRSNGTANIVFEKKTRQTSKKEKKLDDQYQFSRSPSKAKDDDQLDSKAEFSQCQLDSKHVKVEHGLDDRVPAKGSNAVEPLDLEVGIPTCTEGPSSQGDISTGGSALSEAAPTPEVQRLTAVFEKVPADVSCKSSQSDDGFVSCEEESDCEDSRIIITPGNDVELAPPGMRSIAGIWVAESKLPDDRVDFAYDAFVADIVKQCSPIAEISVAQALRLSLGMNFDVAAIVSKWTEICAWRKVQQMSKERSRCVQLQMSMPPEPISFPHQTTIYTKAFSVSPCSLITQRGEPVTIWHVGTGSAASSSVPVDKVAEWGRSVFEYTDVWAKSQSEVTGYLLGQIQVFDMAGVGVTHLASTALKERFKIALGCGANYVELTSRIYVINSSWAFSKIWNMIKPLLSPRTASKVTVATDVPQELFDMLTHVSAAELPKILREPRTSVVQRPPAQHYDSECDDAV